MAKPHAPRLDLWDPREIRIGTRLSALKPDVVKRLAESIAEIGLQNPIDVTIVTTEEEGDVAHLVAGRHRVAACIELGKALVDVRVIYDPAHAEFWQVAENHARSDLTRAERERHTAAAVALSTAREISRQPVAKSKRNPKGSGRPPGPASETAQQLGVSTRTVQRALKAVAAEAAPTEAAVEPTAEPLLTPRRAATRRAPRIPPPAAAPTLTPPSLPSSPPELLAQLLQDIRRWLDDLLAYQEPLLCTQLQVTARLAEGILSETMTRAERAA